MGNCPIFSVYSTFSRAKDTFSVRKPSIQLWSKNMELQVKPRASGINKKDLTEQLAKVANIPKVRAAEYINILTNIISNALQEGKKVTISDFGTFNLSERTAFRGY